MALIAMTLGETVEHVSDMDPAKGRKAIPLDPNNPSAGDISVDNLGEGATIFELSPLDVFLMAHIYDNAQSLSGRQGADEIGIHTRVNQTNIDAVRHGLKGVRNFSDQRGNAIRFTTQKSVVNGREYDVASDDVMRTLGLQLIQELGDRIKEISEVSKDETKN